MPEKSLSIEAFAHPVFEDRDDLYYQGSKTAEVAPDDQVRASQNLVVINLGEAPDGGLRAWLVIVASVYG